MEHRYQQQETKDEYFLRKLKEVIEWLYNPKQLQEMVQEDITNLH